MPVVAAKRIDAKNRDGASNCQGAHQRAERKQVWGIDRRVRPEPESRKGCALRERQPAAEQEHHARRIRQEVLFIGSHGKAHNGDNERRERQADEDYPAGEPCR